MKSEKSYGTRFALAAGVCLALMLAGPSFFGQETGQETFGRETKEKVTVEDVERTFLVRLPKGYDAKQHYPVMVLLLGIYAITVVPSAVRPAER